VQPRRRREAVGEVADIGVAVGPQEGVVGSPASATQVVELLGGAVRLLAVVTGVPALRHVLMGGSTGSISDKNF
jgi:hypothetical protein